MAKKVLIVEDEQDVVTYLSTLLSDAGYQVAVAPNGLVGLEAVKADKPDLVSLDIMMPEKSGVKFYREMRETPEHSAVPIVIVTGISNPWAAPDGSGSFEHFISSRKQVPPPDGFFEKPVDREKYVAKVAELLA